MKLVKSHDAAKEGYSLALNKFADLSPEEFEKMQGFKAPSVDWHDDDASVEPE